MPFTDNWPKMLGEVKVLVTSSMCPCEVPAHANARFGMVSVGADENQRSETAKPFARPDSTGSIAGVYMPMMSRAVVPGSGVQPDLVDSQASVAAKLVT